MSLHLLECSSDAAGGDDGRLGADLELADAVAVRRLPSDREILGEHAAAGSGDATVLRQQLVGAVPEQQRHQSLIDAGLHQTCEGSHDRRSRAPGDVEPGDAVAEASLDQGAPLGVPDDGEERHAPLSQPAAHVSGRPAEVGIRPLPAPVIAVAVEASSVLPVGARTLVGIPDSQPPLLRGVDHEEAAEGPEGLATEGPVRLLLDDRDAAAAGDRLGCGDQTRQSRSDDEDIRASCAHGWLLKAGLWLIIAVAARSK